jgi:hypothetical protein
VHIEDDDDDDDDDDDEVIFADRSDPVTLNPKP